MTIVDQFVRFYTDRDHTIVDPAPLVPRDDPTLLFNSAGMVQFKKLYSTADPLPYRRAVSVQPCLRAGGKDSDIENVGRTPRHLSFFQMLGNFSFGDYFKHDAIVWGWELLTEIYGMNPDKLWVSVYEDDDEAEKIWLETVGIRREHVVRLGKKDNFWGPAGKTGACGPCSEIHFDRGEGGGNAPGDDGDRFLEIYNLVFPQFDMQEDGSTSPLRNRGIDTGMGLERVAMVLQDGETLFDTDQFLPVIAAIEEISGRRYAGGDPESKRAMRVIADHVRGLTFTLGEGIIPSNDGRGYVLRRILRRALRFGWGLGIEEGFLPALSSLVVDQYHARYPYLDTARESIALALRAEESQFAATLSSGMARFESVADGVGASGVIPGDQIFMLYDTYGFPVDLIEEMASDRGLGLDRDGFDAAMTAQRERSRAASQFDESVAHTEWESISEGPSSRFVGYEMHEAEVRVRKLASREGRVLVVLDRTPFYAESGGQIGDTGEIVFSSGTLRVDDTHKLEDEITHILAPEHTLDAVRAMAGEQGTARIDVHRRKATERNHTATHLLHAALRQVLGTHVAQKGSFVGPDRLRFDFSHFQPMTNDEIIAVERLVAREIIADTSVTTEMTPLKDALAAGAMALFGEKYGDTVRQVVVPGFSRELCGGCHVGATGQIGPFRIVSETGVAAGVRRIEAISGVVAVDDARETADVVARLARTLGTSRTVLEEKLDTLMAEKVRVERELDRAREAARRAQLQGGDSIETIGDVQLLVQTLEAENPGELRKGADVIRQQLTSGVAVLGADVGGKLAFLVLVTPDLVKAGRFRADELVREIAAVAGGSGGGKPDMALAGAKDVDRLTDALDRGRQLVIDAQNARGANA